MVVEGDVSVVVMRCWDVLNGRGLLYVAQVYRRVCSGLYVVASKPDDDRSSLDAHVA